MVVSTKSVVTEEEEDIEKVYDDDDRGPGWIDDSRSYGEGSTTIPFNLGNDGRIVNWTL